MGTEDGPIADHDSLFFVMRGEARLEIMGVTCTVLKPGDCHGLMGLLGIESTNNTGTLTATTICDIFVMSRRRFVWALGRFPEERMNFEDITRTLARERPSETIKSVAFFQNSHPRFVQLLAENVEDKLFWPGNVLCEQGEVGNCMFLLHR